MNMKIIYETPVIQITKFSEFDVIVTSGESGKDVIPGLLPGMPGFDNEGGYDA